MAATDVTLSILQEIQDTLAGHDARFDSIYARFDSIEATLDEHGQRLHDLEQHVVANTEILAALNDHLGFFERAAMTANHARVRLVPPDDPVAARVLVIQQQRGRPEPARLDDEPA